MKKLFLGTLAVFVVFAMLGCQQDADEVITIRFDPDYEGAQAPASISIKVDEPVGDRLPIPTRDGYYFACWLLYSNGDWIPVTRDTVFSAGTTLYAKWMDNANIIITFHLNYVAPQAQTRVAHMPYVPIGNKIPENPTREDFTFMGWYRNSQGTGSRVRATDTFINDTIVYASWRNNRPDVTISFDVNFPAAGGTPPQTPGNVIIKSGDKITQQNIPALGLVNGYLFQGWYPVRTETGGTRVKADTVFTTSVTIYARWKVAKLITLTADNKLDLEEMDAPFTPTPSYTIESDGSLSAALGDKGGQGILFEFTQEMRDEINLLDVGDQILVRIDGSVDNPGSFFRMYLCLRGESGANWNGTNTHALYPCTFDVIKDINLEFGINKTPETTRCFVIQWNAAGDPGRVNINIKSISIYY